MRSLTRYVLLLISVAPGAFAQPIFDYVSKPDAAYAWEKVSETDAPSGCKLITLKLTSQVWQGLTWTHQLVLMQPPKMDSSDTAFLVINGGKLGPQEMGMLSMLAVAVSGPLVYLGDIPNQPLFERREDALIAYTFQRFLETGDYSWPLLYPMTKSAVRAMDAVQEYTKQNWPQRVEKFVVTGASKRGWTTWFTGAVDPQRVAGIVPIVYDNLNLPVQMAHQKASYAGYSSQIDDYTALGLLDLLQTEQGKAFGANIDPYTYRDRLTMPKLLINGTNDPYWVVDSANLYFNDLPQPKYLLNQPNTPHSIDPLRALAAEGALYLACAGRVRLPQLNWHFDRGETELKLGILTDVPPKRVVLWTTTAPTRDFRKSKWESRELEQAAGQWVGHLVKPEAGYAALFGEIIYDFAGHEVPLSTTIEVIGGQ